MQLATGGERAGQAAAAIAQRLGAQALAEPRSRALLLAREGRTRRLAATRGNLLAALLRSPAAIADLRVSGTSVIHDALSPDGRPLASARRRRQRSSFDTAALHEIGPRFRASGQISYFGAIVRPVRALAFSPDGGTLAVGESDGYYAQVFLIDSRTHRVRASATSDQNAVTADVAFAPDGRTFVTGEAVSGRVSPPDEVLVLRSSENGRELQRSPPISAGRLVGFTSGGSSLFVTSGETRSLLLDARTFKTLRSFPVSGAAALSLRMARRR